MSSKDENEKLKEEKENKNENENEDDYENGNEDDETMGQNEIKELNGYLDGIIDKSKSFDDEIESLK